MSKGLSTTNVMAMPADWRPAQGVSVAIIGLGRIGGILLKCLLRQPNVSRIGVFSKSKQDALWEEIRQINIRQVELRCSDDYGSAIRHDYIFLAASIDYAALVKGKDIHDSWLREIEGNRDLVRRLLPHLAPMRGKTLIVYTNPVDMLCKYLHDSLDASNRIHGFGSSLDTLRLRALARVNGMVLGEHGVSMVPTGVSSTRGEIEACRNVILASVARVIREQGYTSLGPEAATLELLHALWGGQEKVLPMSCHDPELGISIGMPCRVCQGAIEPLAPQLNQAEAELFQASVDKIKTDLARAGL